MAAAAIPAIRILLVTADPEISQAVAVVVDGTNFGYVLGSSSSREDFLSILRFRPPDVILVGEKGLPRFPLGQVLVATRKISATFPLVVIDQRRAVRSAARVAHQGDFAYLRVADASRLPAAIERALGEQKVRISQSRLRSEIDRAARLIGRNQKLATIGQLAGSIAHEINNPLESVTNLLFLVENEKGLPQPARDYLALARKELDRVVQISKQTLNFYRESPIPVRVRLGALLDDVLVLYSRRIAEKHLEVVRDFVGDEPVGVFPGEIRQVFSNLIVNAIEASADRGKLHLRLRKSRDWRDPGVTGVRVTIADEGVGSPAKLRSHVGEPFFTTKGEAGTGLGIWVTRSIIMSYGGNLLLRSSTGRRHGTAFTLFLPTNLRPQAVKRHGEAMMLDSDRSESGAKDAGREHEMRGAMLSA
jgi:two-component system, NtrC family, sensor kinase